MYHIFIRKIAIMLASVSFGALMAVALLVSVLSDGITATQHTSLQITEPEPVVSIHLPQQIPGTALIARNLAVYDGQFFEDGSGEEVFGVAALVVQNSSGEMLWTCNVELALEGECYHFEGMLLPPYATVMIPERNAKKYVKSDIVSCEGTVSVAQEPPPLPVCISATGMDSLQIQNISQQSLSRVVVYHKTYLCEAGMYIGGKAFQTALPTLGPLEQITVKPENYAMGYSQLLCVYSSEFTMESQ